MMIHPGMSKQLQRLFVCAALFMPACKSAPATPAPPPTLEDNRLNETSGIAASVANAGLYYVHNDSGDTSRFFAIDTNGKMKGVFYFNGDHSQPGLGVQDCEDIAVST